MTTVPRLVVLDAGAFWAVEAGMTGVSSELRCDRSRGAKLELNACGGGIAGKSCPRALSQAQIRDRFKKRIHTVMTRQRSPMSAASTSRLSVQYRHRRTDYKGYWMQRRNCSFNKPRSASTLKWLHDLDRPLFHFRKRSQNAAPRA
jgi:hypothetical protein